MSHFATFYFSGALQVFLPKQQRRHQVLTYSFGGSPAIKDAIEAQGVPHTEVEQIKVNGQPVDFMYKLQQGDVVQVSDRVLPGERLLREPPAAPARFVADVHLGKLARLLRLLGFDVWLNPAWHDQEIVRQAEQDKRIVLTRDVHLLKLKLLTHGYWLRSQQPEEQLREVMHRYRLLPQVQPFSRCMSCNGCLLQVQKQEVLPELEPATSRYFNEFYRCSQCRRIYWKGSHYERMEQFLEQLLSGFSAGIAENG